jgi:TonB family protein
MSDYQNDIDKYLKGQLTPAQMHALEKKALSDPFLADALEGIGSLDPAELQSDLQQLQANLNKRIQKRSGGWTWTSRIAAGLLLVAISTFVVISISDRSVQKPAGNLALNKENDSAPERESEQPAAVGDSSRSNGDVGPDAGVTEELKKDGKASPKPSAESRSQAEQPLAQTPAEEPEAPAKEEPQDILSDADISESLEAEEKVASGVKPPHSVPPVTAFETDKKTEAATDDRLDAEDSKRKAISGAAARERANSYAVNRKIIRGKVTFSEDGMGLPGVNVLVKGTNEGTVTDEHGNYQIPVLEGHPTLLFSFIGFANKEIEATDEEVNVQLDADVSELSEVVVVGYGSKDVEFLPSTPTVMELATPEGGRKVFKEYLEKNLRYPEQALKNGVEGKVTVQFTIGMTGQLSDFRVIRGLGHGCDEEVIRLIKDGPKWAPTKKNEAPIKDRVRVRMRFSLPKK